jgi:hypothetical protein
METYSSENEIVLSEKGEKFFPSDKLIWLDYLIGGVLLLFCFLFFFHDDLFITGLNSLNYLFGNPLDFYENCRKYLGGGEIAVANYPPSVFLSFALWLYPFKLLGLITSPAYFPVYMVYWLKVLTTLMYLATGMVFYKVSQLYYKNKQWSRYAALIWLTTPLALFEQVFMSLYDIFYILLTLWGFFYFLKQKTFLASLIFGLAITFKYFPLFVFFPLLLFFEKRISRIAVCTLIFALPMLVILLIYGQSPNYIEGVLNFSVIYRIYYAFLDVGYKIYYIFSLFIILLSVVYLLDNDRQNSKEVAAYIFLFSSVFPFLFIFWHPQWILFITPAIVLTSCLLNSTDKMRKFFIIDLAAMFFYIGYVTSAFPNNVDLRMFHPDPFHLSVTSLEATYSITIAELFNFFKGFSPHIYFSLFWGYLVFQLIYKYAAINNKKRSNLSYSYTDVRIRFYIGLLIFITLSMLTFYKNYIHKNFFIVENYAVGKGFGELIAGRTFEQIFIAEGNYLKEVDLLLVTYARMNHQLFKLEILNADRTVLAAITRNSSQIANNSWEPFKFLKLDLKHGEKYVLRLSSNKSKVGDAITWWASNSNLYKKGYAIVDGIPQDSSFSFKLKFE